MSELALIFCTIDTSRNFLKRRIRRNSYNISIDSILRWLPEDTDAYVIDNSNFFYSRKGHKFLQNSKLKINNISANENLGKLNKGLGELSMLEHARNSIDFTKFERIYFFTGRHFITNPYLFEKIKIMNFDIAISKPNFFQLNGHCESDGDLFSYNDMFFSMKPKQLNAYIDFFELNRNRLLDGTIGSEQLLYEFVETWRVKWPGASIFIAPALGILRFTKKISGKLGRLEIL